MRTAAMALAAGTLTCFVAPAAFAQEQPQAENIAAARSLGMQGIKQADAGDCAGAIENLSRAEALYHAPSILGRLGECQVNVGQIVLGTENLNRVVREQLAPNAPKAFRDAQERAKGVLATALPKIARLTIRVEPADAKPQVSVGAVVLPPALIGVERPTDPGTHEVVVSAPGYLEKRSTITLAEGGAQQLALQLDKDPNALAPAAVVAPAPVAAPAAQDADTSPKKNNTLAYVALGVGGAGLLVGTITGVVAMSKKSDLQCQGKACPSSQEDALDSAQTMATVSTIGFSVGLVGVGVGVVLLLTGNSASKASLAGPQLAKHEPGRGLRVGPWFGSEAAGLQGSF
jgi:hypothetical protein